jgi:hypothetical protein
MSSCPHITHQTVKEVDTTGGQEISFCRESCSKTFFFCSHCREANRPLARFCRHCGEPISYAATEAGLETSLQFSVRQSGGESYPLSRYNIKEASALKSYLGFLLVVADSAVLIFDTHSLHEPLKLFRPPDGQAVRGVNMKSLPDDELLLISTAQSIYQLSLLELNAAAREICKVSRPSRFIYHEAFYCVDDIYFLEYDEADRTSMLIRFPDQVIATFNGFSRHPLTVGLDQIFLCTENQFFLYDTKGNALKDRKSPEYLERSVNPAYSEELETVYLVGENNLWRLELNDPEISPSPLSTKAVGDPRIAASGDKLFVARSNGLLILNPFGDVNWDSNKHFISASSDLRAPEIYPNYFIFTSVGKLGGSGVRVHSREYPSRFDLISYEKRLNCSPLLSLGRLIALVGEASAMELKVN